MTMEGAQIAVNRAISEVPAQWAHLNPRNIRHFIFDGAGHEPCAGCGRPFDTHVWRVRSASGAVLDCAVRA